VGLESLDYPNGQRGLARLNCRTGDLRTEEPDEETLMRPAITDCFTR
jgi:hypothetical protein